MALKVALVIFPGVNEWEDCTIHIRDLVIKMCAHFGRSTRSPISKNSVYSVVNCKVDS